MALCLELHWARKHQPGGKRILMVGDTHMSQTRQINLFRYLFETEICWCQVLGLHTIIAEHLQSFLKRIKIVYSSTCASTSKVLQIALTNLHSYPQILRRYSLGNLSHFYKCSWETLRQPVLPQTHHSPLLSEWKAGKNPGPHFTYRLVLLPKIRP